MTRARDLADSADKDISGTVTLDDIVLSNDMTVADNGKVIFGAGSDLQIYHDGSNSIIADTGTGNLIVKTNGNNIQFEDSSGNDIFKVTPTATNIYHGASGVKLATSSSGVDVTGRTLAVDGAAASDSPRLNLDLDGTNKASVLLNRSTEDLQLTVVGSNDMTFTTNASEVMRISSAGNVGIRTNSPHDGGVNVTVLNLNGVKGGSLAFSRGTNSATKQWAIRTSDDEALRFEYGSTLASEAMRITSTGDLLVGTTNSNVANQTGTTQGVRIAGAQNIQVASTGVAAYFNKLSTDGSIVEFRKSGSTVGSIGTYSGGIFEIIGESSVVHLRANEGVNSTGSKFYIQGNILPWNNDYFDLGSSNFRFDDIFATNGTIQTSDQNEKQQIASLTDAEMTAAKAISKLFKTFKWNDSVAENGDAARTHTGVIAQQVQTAMSDAGLNAGNYAFWCSDTWTNDDGNEQTRLGVRYPELLAFVGAATEQRLANIETRLTALEG